MTLKAKLESLEGVSAELQKEYKKVEEGGKAFFTLDVEGAFLHEEDIGPLKRARDYEKAEASKAKASIKEATTKLEALQEELDAMRRGAIPKGDVEKLEESWKGKMTKVQTELTAERDTALTTLQRLLVDNVAQGIAGKISMAPDLILPHVKARLTTEKTSDGYVTRVLDADGKMSALTVEELQKDLSTDKRFAAIIIGSKASGGGAAGGDGGRSGAPIVDPKFNPNTANPKQLAAHIAAKKAAAQ